MVQHSLLAAAASAVDPSGEAILAALLPIMLVFLIVFVVIFLLVLVLLVVSKWEIFVKAGRPGWAALIPFYNTTTLLEIIGKPLWWVLLMFIPVVNLVILIIMARRLATVFGKGAGFTVGLIFLPFIFFPILAFGKASYHQPFPAPRPMSETTKWALIAAGACLLFEALWLTPVLGSPPIAQPLSTVQDEQNTDSGYAIDGTSVYYYDHLVAGADPLTFHLESIPSADSRTLSDNYAADDTNVYWNGGRVEGANSASFTLLDMDYARDNNAAYYDGAPLADADLSSFAVPQGASDSGYALDGSHVYSGDQIVDGADPQTFKVIDGKIQGIQYDAKDAHHYYDYGSQVK